MPDPHFNTLLHGDLPEVIKLLEGDFELDESRVRAVLTNVVRRMIAVESVARQAANTASCLANGIIPD